MYPLIFIAGHTIGTYALLGVIGILVSATFATFKLKKFNIPLEDVIIYTLISACGALIGGHLLYGLVNFDLVKNAFITLFFKCNFKKSILEFMVAFGGSVYYGSFIGLVVSLLIALKNNKNKFEIFDIATISIPLFHVFGRIGCFFGGCCYGIESKIGFIVHNNPIVPDICGIRRFPVALLEAFLNLIIFFVLNKIYKSGKQKCNLLWFYGLFYSIVRFNVEFLRGDKVRGTFLGLSTSAWISVALFLTSIIAILRKSRKT